MEHSFSIRESLQFGWRKTREHSGLLFQVLLTLFAVQIVYQLVVRVLGGSLEGVLAIALLLIASIVVGTGLMVVMLKIARGQHATYRDIIPPAQVVIEYTLASLLSALIICIGLVLLIIPGLYFLARYSMVRFAVLDGAGITGSLRKSAALTQGIKWKLLGFLLVVLLLNILGAILLLVGLLVSVPVTVIAYAHVYQKLAARAVEAKS